MTVEVLLLAVACGITLLAYMIAINAHGPTRLSLSYFLATVMLAGTVWGIVQYVNTDLDARKMEEFKKLEAEKQIAEQRVQLQEQALKANKERMSYITKLNSLISLGAGHASSMINSDLQDRSIDLDALIRRASETKKNVELLKKDFEKLITSDSLFPEPTSLIKGAVVALSEASYYYRSYYYSEDSDQEELREKILRQKARLAYDQFQKANSLIATAGN